MGFTAENFGFSENALNDLEKSDNNFSLLYISEKSHLTLHRNWKFSYLGKLTQFFENMKIRICVIYIVNARIYEMLRIKKLCIFLEYDTIYMNLEFDIIIYFS